MAATEWIKKDNSSLIVKQFNTFLHFLDVRIFGASNTKNYSCHDIIVMPKDITEVC